MALQRRRVHKGRVRLRERRVTSSRQVAETRASASARRISLKDVLALLFVIAWCTLGAVKTMHDVAAYRAQQAAVVAFDTRYAGMAQVPNEGGLTPAAPAPYDPALGRWLIGETVGYLLTLVVVAVGSYRAGRRRALIEVKWIAPTRQAVAESPGRPTRASIRSGGVAAERLSLVVWTDRVMQLEKERA
jgi:hypothetical protein